MPRMTGQPLHGLTEDSQQAEALGAYGELRAGGRLAPLGLPVRPLRLSWAVPGAGELDGSRGFDVTVDRLGDAQPLWSAHTTRPWVAWDGRGLESRSRYEWHVSGVAGDGRELVARSTFETGLATSADWSARWIAAPVLPHTRESWDPAAIVRHEFTLPFADLASARVYVTARGLYRLWLNGVELTADQLFRPGWTDYRTRIYHQTFDCTAALRPGRNVLAATLAKGWYAGRLGLLREPGFYGDRTALMVQLEAQGVAGESVVIGSDEQWLTSHGAILASDLLRGESQDLRQEPPGWRLAGFDATGWEPAEALAPEDVVIEPQPHDSIAIHQIHPGTLVREHARGPAVFDFGQNLVGWTRISSEYLPSVELIVRHGEILTPEDLVYRDNLRGAFQEDHYVVPDAELRTLEPSFGFHGFRYAEIWGLPSLQPYASLQLLPTTSVEAVSVTGLLDEVGEFSCSNERLTKLAQNIAWTVRDNFLEVMTDCPQREERHGWLGDAGVISPTAAYMFDISAFAAKFAQDAADSQGPDGEIRNWVPATTPANLNPGAPGWSDGFIRIVHLLVERYGDLATAERLFDSMAAFLDHIDRANPDGLRTREVGADFGDWLSLPDREGLETHFGYAWTGAYSTTPRPVVDTAHSYRSFVQMSEICTRLGRADDAARYAERAAGIRDAYRAAFVSDDIAFAEPTQTSYAQAIGFGLLEGDDARRAAVRLRELIERTGHITTGIHGVEHVLPVLCAHGHAELAIELLLRDELPSWLYMVAAGGTTIWEKWDGLRPDGTLATAQMNSFNHCALGAVGRFLYEGVAGLDASQTAWSGQVLIHANYTRALDWARAAYGSPGGRIVSHWRWDADRIVHELEIPGCASAEVQAPAGWLIRHDSGERTASASVGSGCHSLSLEQASR